MSRESHNDVVTRQEMSDGDARLFAGEKALILGECFDKHTILGKVAIYYLVIEYYATLPLSIMLLGR